VHRYGIDDIGRPARSALPDHGAHGAWRERNGEEGRRTRRPITLLKPRGARGASASVPGPRWGLRRRQRTAGRPTSRGALERWLPEIFPSSPV
jgi:hypothetical protein